jgi:hypothetical protein
VSVAQLVDRGSLHWDRSRRGGAAQLVKARENASAQLALSL